MKTNQSRRTFLKTATVAGAGYMVGFGNQMKRARANALEDVAVAGIGIGGKGGGDISQASKFGKVVALCDIDRGTLAGAAQQYEGAKTFEDFRDLFADMGDKFDACVISTTDHMHCPITAMALKAGKHCYTQKPLTRTIGEARYLGNLARATGLCTQMGNQGSAGDQLRKNAAQLRAGVIGEILEVHARTNRPIWAQGPNRAMTMEKFIAQVKAENPDDEDIVNDEIAEKKKQIEEASKQFDWKLWLGVAPWREYWPGLYHAFQWRGWWDFGTGAIGDMACHNVNMVFKGTDLRNPTSVQAISSGHDFDSFPAKSVSKFEFPANDWRGPIKFTWWDSSQAPEPALLEKYKFPEIDWTNSSLVIGDKGAMLCGGQGDGIPVFRDPNGNPIDAIPEDQTDFVLAPVCDEAADNDTRNKYEWFNAIWQGKPELCWSNFPNHGGPLTETMLLANLAVWAASEPDKWGEKIEWDAENLKVTNLADLKTPKVADLVCPVYGEGYDQIEV
ncbi:MAG: Gfo/Idh/MocA family oxidoreductase [Thermoguttaceae bacterium]|nr:Gfo/Idh/MocA family oxidoreductase [Thermoguttaceae bacterium]MBQ6621060.1 Gfo/Idh/MocA family oxidoreductase [Thermoguttaceae bacterium]